MGGAHHGSFGLHHIPNLSSQTINECCSASSENVLHCLHRDHPQSPVVSLRPVMVWRMKSPENKTNKQTINLD